MDSYYDSNTRCPRSSKNVDNNNQTLIRLRRDYYEKPLSVFPPLANYCQIEMCPASLNTSTAGMPVGMAQGRLELQVYCLVEFGPTSF